MRLILLGAPGAGKGTQAASVCAQFGIPHISTGDILRSEVASGSPLGLKVKGIMDRGELVTDDVIVELVTGRLAKPDCAKGFLLDGAIRTVPQAEALGVFLKNTGTPLPVVVLVDVPEEVLIERIVGRGKVSGRSDDSAEVAVERLRVYRRDTEPLVGYYEGLGLLRRVDGVGAVDEVFERILKALKA
jgi:adenylate kinase